jgi:hypothetical protein
MPKTLRFPVLACVCVMLGWGCSSPKATPAAPGETWPTSPPEEQGFDSDMLAEVVEQIDREDLPVDSLLVVRNGVLIVDAHFYPCLGDRAHDLAPFRLALRGVVRAHAR